MAKARYSNISVDEDHLVKSIEGLFKVDQRLKALYSYDPVPYYARYGVVNTEGNFVDKCGACHAGIRPLTGASVLYSKWTGKDKPADDLYLRWLVSPESPFASCLPPDELVVDGHDIASLEFMKNYGFIFWHISKLPSNVQHQFLVATRLPYQQPTLLARWHYLVMRGFDPSFAYIWMSLWYTADHQHEWTTKGCKRVQLTRGNLSEFPLDTATSGPETPVNFMLGHMVGKKNPPFAKSSLYTPVNQLWGPNNLSPYTDGYPQFIINTYGPKSSYKLGELQKEQFGNGSTFFLGHADMLRIAEIEQSRLLGVTGIKKPREIK